MGCVLGHVSQRDAGSVHIRTDDGNEWRYDAIQKAATFYDCNRSNAVAFACNDIDQLVSAARAVLKRDDLTREQRWEIAETLCTRAVYFDLEPPADFCEQARNRRL